MSEFIGYVYLTTNKINGKIYVGQKQREKFIPYYLGTGKAILRAIKKYGKENFTVEPLYWAVTNEDLNDNETWFIAYFNSRVDGVGYNISLGGNAFMQGIEQTEEHRKHNSEAHKGQVSYNKGKKMESERAKVFSQLRKGTVAWNRGLLGFRKGEKRSEETRAKISASSIGKKGTRNGVKLTLETITKIQDGRRKTRECNLAGQMIPWDVLDEKEREPRIVGSAPWNKGKVFTTEEKEVLGYYSRKRNKVA